MGKISLKNVAAASFAVVALASATRVQAQEADLDCDFNNGPAIWIKEDKAVVSMRGYIAIRNSENVLSIQADRECFDKNAPQKRAQLTAFVKDICVDPADTANVLNSLAPQYRYPRYPRPVIQTDIEQFCSGLKYD